MFKPTLSCLRDSQQRYKMFQNKTKEFTIYATANYNTIYDWRTWTISYFTQE